MKTLFYVGQKVADDLAENIGENIPRYREGNFQDLAVDDEWQIPLSVPVDLSELHNLSADRTEAENSMCVGRALGNLTPALARENRIWVRLSHVECLEYSRKRWKIGTAAERGLERLVGKHFFAPTLTGCRDDHAIARLWWNFHIARQIMPDNPERALGRLVARADVRQGVVERPRIAARPMLGRGIVHILETHKGLAENEELFRKFMKRVNLMGAGIAFEVWRETEIYGFMKDCLEDAQR